MAIYIAVEYGSLEYGCIGGCHKAMPFTTSPSERYVTSAVHRFGWVSEVGVGDRRTGSCTNVTAISPAPTGLLTKARYRRLAFGNRPSPLARMLPIPEVDQLTIQPLRAPPGATKPRPYPGCAPSDAYWMCQPLGTTSQPAGSLPNSATRLRKRSDLEIKIDGGPD